MNEKQKGEAKTARIPIKIVPTAPLKKPDWIRVKAGSSATRFADVKAILRDHALHTVCEEATCPNIGECFGKGTATFMILGDLCTRRCPFCDVGHGKPLPPDADEPQKLAETVAALKLKYVVVTSVDRDDLRDGGAALFAACIDAIRRLSPATKIEVLVPDFRGRLEIALDAFAGHLPDVMNHNLETVPRLYKQARPGADYAHSLLLLKQFKARHPQVATKSGLMVGLGETDDEILATLRDLRNHDVEMLTVGQYLAPSGHHLPVSRYVHPDVFRMYADEARRLGFTNAACAPLVRSSYHADMQAHGAGVVVESSEGGPSNPRPARKSIHHGGNHPKENAMAASMPDLMIHVDESLSPADMQQLEERLRAGAGVVSAHRSAEAAHLLLVSYDSNRTSAHDLLDVVTQTGVHAELVGL